MTLQAYQKNADA